VRRVSTRGHRGSPSLAEEDEQGVVEREVGSPQHERHWRGGTMEAESSYRVGARVKGKAREWWEEVQGDLGVELALL
jgi:hypothetical protein